MEVITAGNKEAVYSIPARFRVKENLHILFWLCKDISWCMFWRPVGLIMIIPTLVIAIQICFQTRRFVSELCHNLAIVLWITANSYWMISEFFHFDEMKISGDITFKHLALIPFISGLMVLAWYYLWWKPRNRKQETM